MNRFVAGKREINENENKSYFERNWLSIAGFLPDETSVEKKVVEQKDVPSPPLKKNKNKKATKRKISDERGHKTMDD